MVLIIRERASAEQIARMSETFDTMIKLAVDVERSILAGGGELRADCEQALLEDGSRQENIWGADWYPNEREVAFGALINIRPRQQNFGLEIQDPVLREQIEAVTRLLLEVD